MWGIYHEYAEVVGEGRVEGTKRMVFTTTDEDYAYEYVREWSQPGSKYWDATHKLWLNCGALTVEWIPDPESRKDFADPVEMAKRCKVRYSQVELVETWSGIHS